MALQTIAPEGEHGFRYLDEVRPRKPALREALEAQGRGDIMIVVGGVIPPQDYPELYAAGAKAIFGPGTPIADAAIDLLGKLGVEGAAKAAAE